MIDKFIHEFPDSTYRKDALYNAANSYEIVGRVDEAIRLFEQYVAENPDDDRSRPLYFRLAGNYASALELDKAVEYYEALYNNTKGKGEEYADAPAALFNAGFLRIGLGDHQGAARDFERYAKDNPEQPDAEQVLFSAGEQWEAVGTDRAMRFYREYVRAHPDTNPDHVMEAYHRIAQLTEESGNARQISNAWDDLAQAYAGLVGSGEVGSAGRHYAAHAEFRHLMDDLTEFRQIEFTSNDDKNADLLLNVKVSQLKAVEDRAGALVETYKDFEYSSGAMWVIGMAYLAYSDMLYNAPPPKGLDDEEIDFYMGAIDEKRIPIEDKGRARLEAVISTAKAQKDWSEWQTNALNELNRRYPLEFAREKIEYRGEGDSNLVPMAGPISARRPEGSEQPVESQQPAAANPDAASTDSSAPVPPVEGVGGAQ